MSCDITLHYVTWLSVSIQISPADQALHIKSITNGTGKMSEKMN